jgi:AcrR family transcriptional regulator
MNRPIVASAETRRERMRAAMLGLLAEMPFGQIQILGLTGRARVGYATFVRHSTGSQGVIEEIAGDRIRELLQLTIPVMHQFGNEANLTVPCRYVAEHESLWRVLLTGAAAHAVRAGFVRQAREWSRRAGGRETSVPVDLGTVCAAGSAIDALAWWLEQGRPCSPEEMAGFIKRPISAPFVGE